VDGGHVYWTNFTGGSIGRANLDGTGADQSFITGASSPGGVAVDALTPISQLIASVEALGLPHGTENSLLAKLGVAQRKADAGNSRAACGPLGAFVSTVKAQSGQKIDAADAAQLIADATAVGESLGCGPA